MLPVLHEWLNLALRWAHVIAAIMWIGDSFLFMWLDSHLEPPLRKREGDVSGELWMTHSGGFYEVVKRRSLRPQELPPTLHWFKWESYTTWITGFFLITVVYYFGDQAPLVETTSGMLHAEGVAISLSLLFGGVVVYDLLCRTPLVNHLRVFGLVALGILMGVIWALHGVFTPRAIFLQVGAMMATVMSSNVLLRIIPAQRHMLAATKAGTPVDTSYGLRAKLRSTHNHYATLPVLLMMLSNHFPSVYGTSTPWFVFALVAVVGVGVKALMNKRRNMHPVPLVGTFAALGLVIFLTMPASSKGAVDAFAKADKVPFDRVHTIIQTRCITCHAQHPANPAFPAPPNGIVLEAPEQIAQLKDRIFVRAVETKTMPLGNMTGMTEEERQVVGAWIAQGGDLGAAESKGSSEVQEPVAQKPAVPAIANPLIPLEVAKSGGNANTPTPVPVQPAQAAAPKSPTDEAVEVFQVRCSMCHGPKGQGNGPAAAAYNPKPRNFTDAAWQASVTDEHIRQTVTQGGAAVGKSASMPAHPDLAQKPEVLKALVKLIRGLKQ